MLVIHPLNTQVVLTQHREEVHQVLLKLTVRAHGSDQVTLTKQLLLTELGVIVSVHIFTLYKMEYKLPFTVSYLTKFLYYEAHNALAYSFCVFNHAVIFTYVFLPINVDRELPQVQFRHGNLHTHLSYYCFPLPKRTKVRGTLFF